MHKNIPTNAHGLDAYKEDKQINTMILKTAQADSSLLVAAIFESYRYKQQ